ncbi:hypothetical protein BGX26_010618 [Mortierella sp. AD094]|nr:hypothetical protein BGX26_010618 [Mortierella sp. AD094]
MFSSPMMLDFNSKRSKITKACDNCRRRRVKCDGVPDGCGGCRAAKTQCIYTTSNTKRGPPKGYVEVIEDRLGKIENMLTNIVKKKVLDPQESSDKAMASQSDNEDNNDDDDRASVYSSDLVEVKKQPPASPVIGSARSNTPGSRSARSGSVNVAPLGRHSPLMSRNRSLSSLLPFSQDNELQHQLASQQDYPGPISQADMAALTNMFDLLGTTSVRTTVPFPWLAPEQSRQYGRNYLQFSAHSLEPPLPTLSRSFAPSISPDVTLEYLNSFFDRFNTFLPIIHQATFMKQWQRESCSLCSSTPQSTPSVAKNNSRQQHMQYTEAHKEHLQDPVAPLSPLLLNALLAVASKAPASSEHNQEANQKMAALSQQFFDNARLLLDDFLDVPRVSTVQALCLMSQFHHHGQWKATRSSGYLSMAIRMAHELGLNRDPEMFNGPEADALRCLWWSMFILDHQFSAWLGLGLLMHGKESNVELPMEFGSSEQRGFIYMVRLVKFGGHDSMVSYIEGSLTSWLSNLTPDMRWQHPNGSGPRRGSPHSPMRTPQYQSIISDANRALILAKECSEIYPAYLYIVYNTTLILLHRPYIVGAAGSPAAAQSNTICTGSGRAITDIAQGMSIEHCSYVVNRFALYALLQAGVIHAMNAVYDKRGSEVAKDYYRRTLRVLEGFLACTAYSGGVAEGIKILEQFMTTTSMAAAKEEGIIVSDPTHLDQNESQPIRKKRQHDTLVQSSGTHSASFTQETIEPMALYGQHQHQSTMYTSPTSSVAFTQPPLLTPTTLSMMTPPDLANGRPQPQYMMELNQQQQQQQQSADVKEQQKLQQLKIQQQHRMYQQMQTFGAGVIKVEPKVDDDIHKLEQQQLQQQQVVRQQLQRQHQQQQQQQQQKQQFGLETKGHGAIASPESSYMQSQPGATATPVIPSHRYAMQMLQQQQQQHQHQHQQHAQHTPITMTMTMTLNAMTMEAQNKAGHDLQMNNMMNPSVGYDPTQFWVDFSGADQTASSTSGMMSPAGMGHDALRIATPAESQSQFGGGGSLWM